MVLFKRKHVTFLPTPEVSDSQEVWIIEETDEVFTSYDAYLERIDYYKQKKFICEITGSSGLDYFTALKYETEASNEVDESFPDALREPVLRKVQHSTISRVDHLVDYTYEQFKQDYYPGESVLVVLEGHERMPGVVREKTRFAAVTRKDGTIERPSFSRYFVSLTGLPDREAIVDDDHLVRDRKALTKLMLRSFLRNSLHRESWTGAPWQVKDRLAEQYHIPTQIPPHLRHETQIVQRKMALGVKKGELTNGNLYDYFPKALPELKPKGARAKASAHALDQAKLRQLQFQEYQKVLQRNPGLFANGHPGPQTPSDPHFLQFISENPDFPAVPPKQLPSKPAPPPIKYPREDLDNPVNKESVRPSLQFMPHFDVENGYHLPNGENSNARHNSVGLLLETWNTLNVYCQVFQLDSFTFDDYVDALQTTSDGVNSELLTEMHCAILKKLVNEENDQNGKVQIRLPDADDSDSESSEDEEDEEDEEDDSVEVEEEEPTIAVRSTRSSLAKSQAAKIRAQAALEAKIHNGAEIDQCVKGYGWKQRLRKRDFVNGRWIVAIVGLLNLFSSQDRHRDWCNGILSKLAPPQLPASEDEVIFNYSHLGLLGRVEILQFLCMLTMETSAVRGYMDECTTTMTEYRKTKMEHQRARKQYLEELKTLEEERRTLQPEAKSPVAEIQELQEQIEAADNKTKEQDEDGDITMEDEDAIEHRSLRRAQDRAAERKKRKEEEKRRKEKAEFDKANRPTKEARQLGKVLKKIESVHAKIKECDAEVIVCDNDLREADCFRTRVLGKDRFWNRYYWYERNAMPYGGLPESSTSAAEYANGRLWVQGPDVMEREGFIEVTGPALTEFRQAHGMTPRERKMEEEGETHTHTAMDWGFYEDPEDVEKLLEWLSDKGNREGKLRKELITQKEYICTSMENRKSYIGHGVQKEEPAEPVARISTRTKTYVDSSGRRHMKWKNITALRELGHLHSEPLKARAKGNTRGGRRGRGAGSRGGRWANRQGKTSTRQGTRYSY